MEVDLRAEPTVVSVPAVPKPRYYAVMLTDANTFNYGYIGSRATGNGPGDYMIVGPDWKGETPPHIKQVFHSSTPFSAVVFRTQLFNAADMPNVVKIQAGYKVQPLSAYLKQPAPPAPPAVNWLKSDAEIAKSQFFEVLDFALQYIPPGPERAQAGDRIEIAHLQDRAQMPREQYSPPPASMRIRPQDLQTAARPDFIDDIVRELTEGE